MHHLLRSLGDLLHSQCLSRLALPESLISSTVSNSGLGKIYHVLVHSNWEQAHHSAEDNRNGDPEEALQETPHVKGGRDRLSNLGEVIMLLTENNSDFYLNATNNHSSNTPRSLSREKQTKTSNVLLTGPKIIVIYTTKHHSNEWTGLLLATTQINFTSRMLNAETRHKAAIS